LTMLTSRIITIKSRTKKSTKKILLPNFCPSLKINDNFISTHVPYDKI
jgi:hypothetical protein